MSIIAINAKNPEEIRVATFDKGQVSDLYVENTLKKPFLKNIYAGVIRSVDPSIAAAFVEYGSERHGFLQFTDIAPEYFKGNYRQNPRTALKVGQTIIVQIKKEEREEKGAALTTYITLPGTYLVLMPNQSGSGGVSKQIANTAVRKDMHQIIGQLVLPENMSVILRTVGAGCSVEVLQHDLELLIKQWEAIKEAFRTRKAPFLIFQEGDILERTVRDYAREGVTEIIVDEPNVFKKTQRYAQVTRPDLTDKVRYYSGRMPLFLHLGIEEEVESAFNHVVRLPSGGSIILNRTAVGLAVDVNSGSSIKHGGITETALKTNLEAAEMIARQLRLRDLGGLILIDFIGMKEEYHRKEVESKLYKSLVGDRARMQLGRILSSFDVLVMSRQRLRASLGKVNEDVCLACQGQGIQRSVESLALSIIRTVEKKLFLKKVVQIKIEASIALTTYLSNEKRHIISMLEQEHQFSLLLLPNTRWELSQYRITGFSHGEVDGLQKAYNNASHSLLSDKEEEVPLIATYTRVPAVERFMQPKHNKLGFVKQAFKKIARWVAGGAESGKHAALPDKQREEAPNLPALRARKPLRPVNKSTFVSGASNSTHKTTSSSPQVASQKSTARKPAAALNRKEYTATDTDSISEVVNKQVQVKNANNTLSSHPALKKQMVNRYGGEPRSQKRGY